MRRVATYRDHRRAVRARTVLAENGLDSDAVVVEGRDVRRCRVAPPANLAWRTRRWAGRGALVGVVAGTLLVTFGGGPVLVAASVLVGALVGVAAALVVRGWRNARRGRHRLVPSAYDVVVLRDADAERAERVLARWWDATLRPPARTAEGDRLLA